MIITAYRACSQQEAHDISNGMIFKDQLFAATSPSSVTHMGEALIKLTLNLPKHAQGRYHECGGWGIAGPGYPKGWISFDPDYIIDAEEV